MTVWITGDTHLGHANIIRFSKRPWLRDGDEIKNDQDQMVWASNEIKKERCEEMDEALIANWNERVKPGDHVYHVGDFAFCKNSDELMKYFKRLRGSIHLIYGNHDKPKMLKDVPFAWQGIRKKIHVGSQKIILDHYAGRTWEGMHKGVWQLYGHSHGSLKTDFNVKAFDVGVDCHDYKPLAFEEISEIMKQHQFVPIDHHTPRNHG